MIFPQAEAEAKISLALRNRLAASPGPVNTTRVNGLVVLAGSSLPLLRSAGGLIRLWADCIVGLPDTSRIKLVTAERADRQPTNGDSCSHAEEEDGSS